MCRIGLWAAVGLASVLLIAMCGCGGGGDGVAPSVDTGTVAGQVVHFVTDQPLGGVTVSVVYTTTVDGRDVVVEKSAVSDANGNFRITGIAAGRNRLLRITPPAWLAVPSTTAVYVDVFANQTTNLPGPVMLIAAGEGPPDIPAL